MTKEITITLSHDDGGYDVSVNQEPLLGIDHPVSKVHSIALKNLIKLVYEAGKEGLVLKVEEVEE